MENLSKGLQYSFLSVCKDTFNYTLVITKYDKIEVFVIVLLQQLQAEIDAQAAADAQRQTSSQMPSPIAVSFL